MDELDTTNRLLSQARGGDHTAVSQLMELYRARLRKMVQCRLDPRLQRRVDESDILQDAFLEAAKRLPAYLQTPKAPFFLWLRQIVGHKLTDAYRQHMGADVRSVNREMAFGAHNSSQTSICFATHLIGKLTTPSQALIRNELRMGLQEALNRMDPGDREILVLRQFEELSNNDAAVELGIEPAAASKRFVRALQRLQKVLIELNLVPG